MSLPLKVEKLPAGGLAILWDDGHKAIYSGPTLRLACKCALCEDEWSGERRLTSDAVAADIALLESRPVGRYGLQLSFSDGHGTGIYTFDRLRPLCECEACGKPAGR